MDSVETQGKNAAKKDDCEVKTGPKESNARIQAYLAKNIKSLGEATRFTGNSTPPEVLLKIYDYIEEEDKSTQLLCKLALVCRSFYEVFTKPALWEASLKQSRYLLLQNTVKHNIWDSHSLNEWYSDLFANWNEYVVLPSEVWQHRGLLTLVLDQLSGMVVCAPSRADFEPYSNDPILAHLLIDCMPTSDCFAYISPELRGTEGIALSMIKRFPEAIVHCNSSLLNDREFIKKAVSTNGECLRYLGDYRQDSELVISAARTSPKILHLARGQAKKDFDAVIKEMAPEPPIQPQLKKPKRGERCELCNRTNRH